MEDDNSAVAVPTATSGHLSPLSASSCMDDISATSQSQDMEGNVRSYGESSPSGFDDSSSRFAGLATTVDHLDNVDHSARSSEYEPPPIHDRSGGTVVADHGRLYNVHIQKASDVTFGDRHIQDAEEAAIARGYRSIPMGDIELHRAVLKTRHCRIYAARVKGRPTTVAVYRGGDEAKDEWQRDVMESARGLCHPNVAQLFAVSCSNRLYVAVYHGDLIPLHELASRRSVLSRAELCIHSKVEITAVLNEIDQMLNAEHSVRYSMFFDPTSQRFCIRTHEREEYMNHHEIHLRDIAKDMMSIPERERGELVARSLNLGEIYHLLWYALHWDSTRRIKWTDATWGCLVAPHVAAVARPGASPVVVATIHGDDYPSFPVDYWWGLAASPWTMEAPAESEWRRISVTRDSDPVSLSMRRYQDFSAIWSCQSEYLRRSQSLRGKVRGYLAPIELLDVLIQVYPAPTMPDAILCVPPTEEFFHASSVISDVPYWSLRADGTERLCPEAAADMELPQIRVSCWIALRAYTEEYYAQIQAIHDSRGLNPYGPDAARAVGYPLFGLITPPGFCAPEGRFFDEDWEDGDESISQLFPVQEHANDKNEDPQNTSYIAAVHLALVVLGLLSLAGSS
ncbi:hypothetical protein MKEN_00163400 [Mycena kentingensis (nom. inval.)]|nr:hypothetical protein MKEN_00163400 [Mycena kentingensis (nom. inval.)]